MEENEKNSDLETILDKLDKADIDRTKILKELNELSKVIVENRLKIIQLENRVDKLDDIAKNYSDELSLKINFGDRISNIENNLKWIISIITYIGIAATLFFLIVF